MTFKEAKEVFLNRGFIKVDGGTVYDPNKWREACAVISDWLEQEPKTGHWIHFAASDDCSECGWSTGKYISPSKYCPNCGAKMEVE